MLGNKARGGCVGENGCTPKRMFGRQGHHCRSAISFLIPKVTTKFLIQIANKKQIKEVSLLKCWHFHFMLMIVDKTTQPYLQDVKNTLATWRSHTQFQSNGSSEARACCLHVTNVINLLSSCGCVYGFGLDILLNLSILDQSGASTDMLMWVFGYYQTAHIITSQEGIN